jgi:hypothetical protein
MQGITAMKEPEYIEGQKAQENFDKGMKALFQVPKDAVVKAEKKARKRRAKASERASSRDSGEASGTS